MTRIKKYPERKDLCFYLKYLKMFFKSSGWTSPDWVEGQSLNWVSHDVHGKVRSQVALFFLQLYVIFILSLIIHFQISIPSFQLQDDDDGKGPQRCVLSYIRIQGRCSTMFEFLKGQQFSNVRRDDLNENAAYRLTHLPQSWLLRYLRL